RQSSRGRDRHNPGELWKEPVDADHPTAEKIGLKPKRCGYVGLEEMVLVTETGCDFLSTPQTTLALLEEG
ncbi:MAG: hypothetical protein IIA64_12805, partial [Planctomycetes bacterium]|nr:hypothetical protein [Planctomycetota bacterium]